MQINDIDFHREKSEISEVLHLFCGLLPSLSLSVLSCAMCSLYNFSTGELSNHVIPYFHTGYCDPTPNCAGQPAL